MDRNRTQASTRCRGAEAQAGWTPPPSGLTLSPPEVPKGANTSPLSGTMPQANWMVAISSVVSGTIRSRLTDWPSSSTGASRGVSLGTPWQVGGLSVRWSSGAVGNTTDEDDEDRSVLEAKRTNLCFLHIKAWARKSEDLRVPRFFVANRELLRLAAKDEDGRSGTKAGSARALGPGADARRAGGGPGGGSRITRTRAR